MATFDSETKIWAGPKVPYKFALDTSIGAEILKSLAETPRRVLHICHDDGTALTCDETRMASIRVAQNLIKNGFNRGDVIGFICRNSTYLPPTLYGCFLIGAPVNPLDVEFKKDDIIHMFGQTKPKLVFCDHDIYKTVKEALDELDNDALIVTMREKITGVKSIDMFLAPTQSESSYEAPYFGDTTEMLAVILCSSGTTGASKGVRLSHAHVLSYLRLFDQPIPYRSLSFSPIFWNTGLVSTIQVALRKEDTRIITTSPFSVDLLVHLIRLYKINFIKFAPYQLTLLLQSPNMDPRDFEGVHKFCVLGSIVSEHLRKAYKVAFPKLPMVIGYGMSESCISISVTKPGDKLCGLTVGRISPNIYVKIVDKQGHALDIGYTGEILAKPEFKFMGYVNNSEASGNAVDEDGFLRTGDIGYVDENGCMFIFDRKKEIMKYKGYQINPSEIENVIQSIEGVEFVSVVGIPDPVANNLPVAIVVKRPECVNLTEKQIMDYVAQKLPEYKHLHGAYFVDELPMTPNGKIMKRFVKVIAINLYNERLDL